jgi:GntR family transcriptional regulator, carbon starvation induced regulator
VTIHESRAARASREDRRSRTLTTDLFEQLRADILHCRLAPGSRLRFKELRERYGSGLSPLREALMRLVSEGLAQLEDHKGFQVAPVSQDEMVDIATTLFELEAVAIRKAIEHGDDRWEANIIARFHELSKRPIMAAGAVLDPEWEARNVAFHESLYAACGSPYLILFCRRLSDRFSRYRRLWARHADLGRDVAQEHRQIMEAVVGRDTAAAVSLLYRHRMTTIQELLANWNADELNVSTV